MHSAKGKFACTIQDLHFAFVRLHYSLSNNGIITVWFSLKSLSLIKKDKIGHAVSSKWYPTTIFTPLALYPVAHLSNMQARESQGKVGKTVREMDGENHFIYRAHAKHNMSLWSFNQDKPSTICADGEAEC